MIPSPPHHLIRPAEQRDQDALGILGGGLVRQHHRFDPARFMEPHDGIEKGYGAFLVRESKGPDTVVLVAEIDGAVAGYVYAGIEPMSWMELRGPAGFLHDVVVAEPMRGRGIATALIERAAEWLLAAGAPRLMLWTAEKNENAHRLFDRLGFRRTMIEMTRDA
jgi:GNAT superfamily N-acetyltransferase